MKAGDMMLESKLYEGISTVPELKRYLKRPPLSALLKESLQSQVITVVAGAGYGKTQTVSAFLKGHKDSTIWLQFSTLDNLATRAWDHFVYAVSRLNEALAAKFTFLGFPESEVAFHKFFDLIAKEMKSDEEYFVVLDDLHLIYDKSVLLFIERIIYECMDRFTFILIARSEPAINMEKLWTIGLPFCITEDDLRFKKSEVVDYFQMQDIILTDQVLTDIYEDTDGWIFAICLLSLTLKKGIIYTRNPLDAVKPDIFKLIEGEIFSKISKELQIFLVKLSFFDHLTLGLLEDLSSNNHTLIAEMSKIGSFIRYDATGTYYIHHLLSEFLSTKRFLLKQDDIIETHRKAGDWYANHGYNIDAILQYKENKQYDEVLNVISTYYFHCSKEIAKFILEIMDEIPQKLYEEKPILTVFYAKFLFNSYKVEEAVVKLSELRKKHEAMPLTKKNKVILGEIYIMFGLISLLRCLDTGEYDCRMYFKTADEYLPDGSTLIDGNNHLNPGVYACPVSRPDKGEFNNFLTIMSEAMPYASRVMNGSGYGTEYLMKTEVAFFQKDLKNAERYAYQAIEKSRECDQVDIEILAIFYLIRMNISFGDYSKIFMLLEQSRLAAERFKRLDDYSIFDITEGWLYTLLGQPHKVASWITSNLENEKSDISFGLDSLVLARYYLSEKKYYELLASLENGGEKYFLGKYVIGAIELRVLKAVAFYRVKEMESAIMALQEAYDLAAPNSLIMPFIEQGSNMRMLVNSIVENENSSRIPIEWLKKIQTKSSTYAKNLANIVAKYKSSNRIEKKISQELTKRELETLTDLCHGLTREEMAVNRNLSVNTVKRMLQNIYIKLEAVNSLEAVRIATLKNLVE